MAVSESVLNAVNLFSSTSVFNANKGSVGATDLNFIKQTTAELATEGGGIIAQSLGTNGYVKFANGLILQWGYYVGSKSKMYVPFHITFQSQCFTVIGCDAAISTTDTGGVDEAVYISDWSLTQFRVSISSDRNTISYIAFGI